MTVHASIRKDYERWLTFLNDEVCFSMRTASNIPKATARECCCSPC